MKLPLTISSFQNEDITLNYQHKKNNAARTQNENRTIYLFIKRIFDISLSLIGLVLLSPLYIILALMIYIDDPDGSPLFWQERVGKDGRIFKFYKFRTMYIDAEDELENLLDKNEMQGPPFKMQNDPRITRFGNKLRATSLDELPQLWNVLKGDMSIVGPRPPLPREAAQYSDHEKTRLSIKPGLTCYWQTCSKRNSVSFDEWVNLDIQYINDRCLRVDLMLIFKTLLVIFSKEGE